MQQLTWAGAAREVWRTAARHKIAAGVVALCVVGSSTGIALASSDRVSGGGASGGGAVSGSVAPAATYPDTAAPAFTLPVLGHSGQRVSLSDYTGKPLIVNFFASWCDPCKQETPLLARFYRTEHGKVALVGLDENDAAASALSFTHANGVTYPVGFDPQITVASAYGVDALPQTFFLNARHRIVERIFGAVTLADLSHGIALATAG
jgi:cytochrome c biogenesis protein CcmG, thiol:disulfide interchange protein DsbE